MDTDLPSEDLLERLAEEARRVAHTTQNDGEQFDELHFVALDIHKYLRQISAEESNMMRQTIASCLKNQSLPHLSADDDHRVAQCLRLLLQMVYKQPQIL
jgi:hypothetical protein